jgi:agmatine/peptidylarginine deiminase
MPRILMITRLLTLALFCLLPASAAFSERDVDDLEDLLPHYETAAERLIWLGREDQMPGRELRSDPPPLAPVRNCAEWEPCTGVLIRYPLGLPYNLLRDFDDDVILHVIVSSSYLSAAQANLTANGVDMAKVQFLVKPNDSIWTRDYGPWFVFDGNGDIAIIDHFYNRPYRPNDNLIPIYFAEQQGISVHSHDMYHTGGNYMTDGAHISSSTQLVYNEAYTYNGMSQAEVDLLMLDYYGVETYYVLDYIESGGIHHIDTWAKFLDEETVLVKQVWSSHHTYATLEQRAVLLASLPASTGRNYQVHRVYCYNIGSGQPASYTNSLILNDRIYLPYFGNATYDTQAKEIYEAAAPGYTVLGYYHSGWLSDDALHCRAKGVMDRRMLRVGHIPIREPQSGTVRVAAYVKAHSGQDLTAVDLHYRQDSGAWVPLPMSSSGSDSFAAVIPQPASTTVTDYYIHATDASGLAAGMPRVEPAAWYSFSHDVDLSGTADPLPDSRVQLHGNYPNPFNPRTTFQFELLYADQVCLDIIDARGRSVRRLVDEICPAGICEIPWDGKDDRGRALPAGVYLWRLRVAGLQYVRTATLIK